MPLPPDAPLGLDVAADELSDAPAFRRALADMAREFLRARPQDPGRAADWARRFARASSVEGVRPRSLFGRG